MRSNRNALLLAGVLSATLALSACIPEANRERGGGAGGDIGNRSQTVNMHGQEDGRQRMYYGTPLMGEGIERSGSAGAVSSES